MVIGFDKNLNQNDSSQPTDAARLQASEKLHHSVYHPNADATPTRTAPGEAHVTEVNFHSLPGYDAVHRKSGEKSNPVDAAREHDGQQLWKAHRYRGVTQEGRLGCAASESIVLQQSGYKYADSAGAANLEQQLKAHGWTKVPTSERQAGDVMFAYKSGQNRWAGGNAHVGTVDSDGEIWNNSSRQGETWRKEPVGVAFGEYDSYEVLRPPKH